MIYICGDSFACSDAEYGPSWVDLLSEKLNNNLVNLSRVGASNLQISLQVGSAIEQGAKYIIYLATSSVRNDVAFQQANTGPLLARYTDLVSADSSKDLISYSIPTIFNAKVFNAQQIEFLKRYHTEFFDIDLAVYQNQMIIEGTLSMLKSSGISFQFDRGGFEHKKFAGAQSKKYFANYSEYFSKLNLWDFVDAPLPYRPYYHINDIGIHQQIANYYHGSIV